MSSARERYEDEICKLRRELDAERAVIRKLESDKRRLRRACVAMQAHGLEGEGEGEGEAGKKVEEEEAVAKAAPGGAIGNDKLQAKLKAAQAEHLELVKSNPEAALRALTHLVKELAAEVLRLRHILVKTGRTVDDDTTQYLEQNDALREEALQLSRKLQHANARIAELERDKVRVQNESEVDDERQFNAYVHRSTTSSGTTSPMLIPGASSPRIGHAMAPSPSMLGTSPTSSMWFRQQAASKGLLHHPPDYRARSLSDVSTASDRSGASSSFQASGQAHTSPSPRDAPPQHRLLAGGYGAPRPFGGLGVASLHYRSSSESSVTSDRSARDAGPS